MVASVYSILVVCALRTCFGFLMKTQLRCITNGRKSFLMESMLDYATSDNTDVTLSNSTYQNAIDYERLYENQEALIDLEKTVLIDDVLDVDGNYEVKYVESRDFGKLGAPSFVLNLLRLKPPKFAFESLSSELYTLQLITSIVDSTPLKVSISYPHVSISLGLKAITDFWPLTVNKVLESHNNKTFIVSTQSIYLRNKSVPFVNTDYNLTITYKDDTMLVVRDNLGYPVIFHKSSNS